MEYVAGESSGGHGMLHGMELHILCGSCFEGNGCEWLTIVYDGRGLAELVAGRPGGFAGLCQLFSQLAFAIALHGRARLVFAKVGCDVVFIGEVVQCDNGNSQYFHQHEQHEVGYPDIAIQILHYPAKVHFKK